MFDGMSQPMSRNVMKSLRHIHHHFHVPCLLGTRKLITGTKFVGLKEICSHPLSEPLLNPQSSEWCERALPKLIKLTPLLKDLDLINGRLVNVPNKCIVNEEFLMQSMRTFKSVGTTFLMQSMHTPCRFVNKPNDCGVVAMDSLKKICDLINVSAQQRKLVRLAICPQVTQHQIWTGALEEILKQLKYEIDVKDHRHITKVADMVQQIVANCLRFLEDVMSYDPDSTSWMRLASKKDVDSPPAAKWADLLEMFNDLINCLKNDQEFLFYVTKLETMKEGLLQIKDVLADKNIGYKEARHQQSLVQKKLTKSLGHSSRCLFTLLLYYLYGSIRDIEVDICWFVEDAGENKFCLCAGKILTSDGEKMLRSSLKQLDNALRVIKFVHEMAEMKEILELQGHLWCIGTQNRSLVYRGYKFFIHGITV